MDSDNILSILSSLGAGQPSVQAPANVLQQAAVEPYYAPPPPPQPVAPPQAAPAAQAAPAPKQRRSLLDTLGRISDVLAKVGGAEALYQPTLDAREDRTLALGDHSRKVDADTLKLATDKFALGDAHNERLGRVARGLQAIQTAGGDINQAWPVLAQRMELDPATIESVGQALATDPNALAGLIGATTDPKYDQSKYGGSVIYGKDANGSLVAYQPSLSNDAARNILPEGITPIDPIKFVDTGGAQVGVGTRSGNPVRILPKSVGPDTKANIGSRERIAAAGNKTRITIAGMPARTGASKDGSGKMGVANTLLDNIERGFEDLHKLKALPGEGSGAGMAAAAFGRTVLGQKIGEQVGNIPAQKRLEIEKDINSLQSEMVKSLPASATRTKFEQEIQRRRMPDPARMSYGTAKQVISDLRVQFAQAQKDAAVELGSQKPTARPKAKAGWTIVEVK